MEASREEMFNEVQPYTGEMEMPVTAVPLPQAPMLRSATAYHTAVSVQKPRNLDKVITAVMREAEFAGDAFYYSYPMGGKKIEGASIGLAMAIAREWGNCAVPVEYYETATEWVFNAHFVDLERGFTVSRVFRRKKGKGLLQKLSDDRAEDMTFQAAQSRAIRNVVLAGVPRWLVDQARERAKEAVIKGISREGIAAATDKALKFLAGYGITEDRVVAVMGKAKAEWSSEDIAQLRGLASQLKDGQATAEFLFPLVETQAAPEPKPKVEKPKRGRPKKDEKSEVEESPAPVQENPATVTTALLTPDQGRRIEELLKNRGVMEAGIDAKSVCYSYDVKNIESLDPEQAANVIGWLEEHEASLEE